MSNVKKCIKESKSNNINKGYTVNELNCHQCVLNSFSVNQSGNFDTFSENFWRKNFC